MSGLILLDPKYAGKRLTQHQANVVLFEGFVRGVREHNYRNPHMPPLRASRELFREMIDSVPSFVRQIEQFYRDTGVIGPKNAAELERVLDTL